jgi:hypothetical protein
MRNTCCQCWRDNTPAFAGNNILKSLKPEYAVIKKNAGRNKYSPNFSVQGLQGSNIDNKRSQIIAIETTMQRRYAIASEKRRG